MLVPGGLPWILLTALSSEPDADFVFMDSMAKVKSSTEDLLKGKK